jgi:hypothetical protein
MSRGGAVKMRIWRDVERVLSQAHETEELLVHHVLIPIRRALYRKDGIVGEGISKGNQKVTK